MSKNASISTTTLENWKYQIVLTGFIVESRKLFRNYLGEKKPQKKKIQMIISLNNTLGVQGNVVERC